VKTGIPDEQDKPERYDCFCNHCSLLVVLSSTYATLQWNLDFSNPPLFEPPDNSSKNPFPFVQSNTVTLPSISRTTRYFKAIFVSLGGSKNRDSIVYQSTQWLLSGRFVLLLWNCHTARCRCRTMANVEQSYLICNIFILTTRVVQNL